MSMQVSYQPSQPIPMKSSVCISMKKEKTGYDIKSVYSLGNKLSDPEASPPNSDFIKRLYLRNIYYNYNMSENSPKPPST